MWATSFRIKLFTCMLALLTTGFIGTVEDASESQGFNFIARGIARRQARRADRQERRAERWGHSSHSSSGCSGEASSCSGEASCSGTASCSGDSSCSGGYSYMPVAVNTAAPCPTCATAMSPAAPACPTCPNCPQAGCPCDCENCTCPKAGSAVGKVEAPAAPAVEAPAPPDASTKLNRKKTAPLLTGYLQPPSGLLTGYLIEPPTLLASR